MGLLKIPGLATGLDTDGLVKTLMSLERKPVDTLQTRHDSMVTEANAWRDLNTRVLTLQKKIEDLNNLTSTDWAARKSSVSDSTVATITSTDSTAAVGSYSVTVNTLALATTWQSGQVQIADSNGNLAPVGDPTKQLGISGTIKVSGGPKDGATFTVSATDSLNDIVNTINGQSAALGFTASVSQVNPGDYRLVLKGNTGAANDFALVDAAGSTAAASLKLDGAGASKVTTAANGSMTVNGSTVNFSDNTVKDAIGGITMTLTKAGTFSVSVNKDQQRIIDAVQKVVDQYNSVVDFMDSLTSYDDKTKKAGTLLGDERINDLRDGIRKLLVDRVGGQADAYNSLAMVGITTQSFASGADYSGKLSFDSSKLTKALDADPNAVKNLFNVSTTDASGQPIQGVATRLRSYLNNYTQTGGILQGRADSINKGVDLLQKEIDRWNNQILPAREQRLRGTFLNLEKAMASLQNQSSWLSSQLGSLGSGSSSSGK
jgi:flagellar hook-associated protein 2